LPACPLASMWASINANSGIIEYENLVVVGRAVGYQMPLPHSRDNRDRQVDRVFDKLAVNLADPLRLQAGNYYKVVPTWSSVEKSIKKLDTKPCYVFREDPRWEFAQQFLFNMFHQAFFSAPFLGWEDIYSSLNINTAAGQPWAKLGLKKKRDCLLSPYFMEFMSRDITKVPPPVWKVSGKVEWYDTTDLDADKVRTFIIPPFHLLLWQKKLFLSQNMSMKMVGWSAYGFNPYRGGTNVLAKRLLKYDLKVFYDAKGWDRVLPVMEEIYNFRSEYLRNKWAKFDAILEWVVENTIKSYLLHPNGTVFFKSVGNNSGSGNTTNDNILGHVLILSYVLFCLYDDIELVQSVFAALFGDDNVCCLPPTSKDVEFEFRTGFRKFGLELDPFCATTRLEECEFLGFMFKLHEGAWIPCYKWPRIVAAYCYCIEGQTVQASLSKMWSLTVMSAGCGVDEFEELRYATEQILLNFIDSQDPVIKSMVDGGVPDYDSVISFFKGTECCGGYPWSIVETYLDGGGFKSFRDEY